MRKDVKEYVKECQTCQQERTFRETEMEHEIEKSLKV